MNHLAHFYLAGDEPELIIGGFLGDFVKGRLPTTLGAAIDRGIQLHRAIDGFTDRHRHVKHAHRHFSQPLRRFAPIITDIVFDHFLARQWHQFHDEPLPTFARSRLQLMLSAPHILPAPALRAAQRMHDNDSLPKYADTAFVEQSLVHLSSRLSRENNLAEGFGEFMDCYDYLAAAFNGFFPEIQAFSRQWQDAN